MSGLLLRGVFNGLVLVVTVESLPGIYVETLGTTLVGATVLGLANALLRPLLLFLTLPLNVTSLGIATMLTNISVPSIMVYFLPGCAIGGSFAPLCALVILTVTSCILSFIIHDR